MYKIAAVSAIAMAIAFPANAGSLRSSSEATATGISAAQSAAGAISSSQGGSGGNGGNVIFNTPSDSTQRIVNSGTTTIRSAPQVVAPSMSSGHPCAFAPVSVGVSVIGFGGAFGGQRIDDACLLAQMGVKNASISMIAARNPQACRALAANGVISPNACGGSRQAAAPVAYAAPAPKAKTYSMTQTKGKTVAYSSLKKGQLYRKNGKLYRKG